MTAPQSSPPGPGTPARSHRWKAPPGRGGPAAGPGSGSGALSGARSPTRSPPGPPSGEGPAPAGSGPPPPPCPPRWCARAGGRYGSPGTRAPAGSGTGAGAPPPRPPGRLGATAGLHFERPLRARPGVRGPVRWAAGSGTLQILRSLQCGPVSAGLSDSSVAWKATPSLSLGSADGLGQSPQHLTLAPCGGCLRARPPRRRDGRGLSSASADSRPCPQSAVVTCGARIPGWDRSSPRSDSGSQSGRGPAGVCCAACLPHLNPGALEFAPLCSARLGSRSTRGGAGPPTPAQRDLAR